MRSGVHRAIGRRAVAIAALAMGAAIAVWEMPARAAQGSGSFGVDINLQTGAASNLGSSPAPPLTGLCRTSGLPGGFGSTVTLVCSTGAVVDISPGGYGFPWMPMNGGAYRYLLQIRRADELLATVDSYTGLGTVTSWRVVHLANWDYVELTVGW